jgi:hypothetical protein
MIHTDGRPQARPPVLTYYGNSVGRWGEGTLVVDSIGERFWTPAAPKRSTWSSVSRVRSQHVEIRGHR